MRARGGGRLDSGVAAVEMAIVLTLIMLLAFGTAPLWKMGGAYQSASSISAETLRFATAVTANGTRPSGGGAMRRRPTAAEVQIFAQQAAGATPVTVTTLVCPGDVASACAPGDPSSATAGDGITVTVAITVDLDAIGSIANAVGSLFGSATIAPQGMVTMTSTAHGREE